MINYRKFQCYLISVFLCTYWRFSGENNKSASFDRVTNLADKPIIWEVVKSCTCV